MINSRSHSFGQLTMLPDTAVAAGTWCERFSHHQKKGTAGSVHHGRGQVVQVHYTQ